MRRILIVTFYYFPDLSAGSFRTTAFVRALREQAPDDVVIDVCTTLPNRYHSYDREAPEYEEQDGVTIRRCRLPAHRSGFRDQAAAFRHFRRSVRREVAGQSCDLVFATSSRLMTAALGASIARKAKVPLYLDIRDIFTDTMRDVLPFPANALVMPVLNSIEKRTVAAADVVNLVSRGFAPHFLKLRDESDLRFFTNGIDPEFLSADFSNGSGGGRKTILYAGNFGAGQGLHRVVPEAARRLGSGFEFRLVGDGGMKGELLESCRGLDNVVIEDPVDRAELMRMYAEADVLFLHLNDYPAFRKVLPSKIFEYAATGKPMLAGVAGYSREFIEQNVDNAAVFPPCDPDGLVDAVGRLRLESIERSEFLRRFARENIMRDMAKDLLSLLPAAGSPERPAR